MHIVYYSPLNLLVIGLKQLLLLNYNSRSLPFHFVRHFEGFVMMLHNYSDSAFGLVVWTRCLASAFGLVVQTRRSDSLFYKKKLVLHFIIKSVIDRLFLFY